jgi:hypothetical protein
MASAASRESHETIPSVDRDRADSRSPARRKMMPRDECEFSRYVDDIHTNLRKHGLVIESPIGPGVPLIVFCRLANSAILNDDARDVGVIITRRVKQWWIAQSLNSPYLALVGHASRTAFLLVQTCVGDSSLHRLRDWIIIPQSDRTLLNRRYRGPACDQLGGWCRSW